MQIKPHCTERATNGNNVLSVYFFRNFNSLGARSRLFAPNNPQEQGVTILSSTLLNHSRQLLRSGFEPRICFQFNPVTLATLCARKIVYFIVIYDTGAVLWVTVYEGTPLDPPMEVVICAQVCFVRHFRVKKGENWFFRAYARFYDFGIWDYFAHVLFYLIWILHWCEYVLIWFQYQETAMSWKAPVMNYYNYRL